MTSEDALGQRALKVMRSQQGATERTVSALLGLLSCQKASNSVVAITEGRA